MSEQNTIFSRKSSPTSSFVTKERVRLLYMQAPISNSVMVIIALLYYFLLQSRIDSKLLLLWVVMLLMTACYRLALYYHRYHNPTANSAKSWLNYYLLGCGLAGCSWSLIYLFVYGTSDPFVLASLSMLAFGVISSAVPVLSVSMPAFILYTYPQGLVLALSFLRFEDPDYIWMALAVGIYLIMTTLLSRNANAQALQSIKLQERNAALINDLNIEISQRESLIAQRTLELEQTNNELITEIKDREHTEAKLLQANTNLDATLQAIPDLLFELDEDGRYIDIWARDVKLLAAQKEALVGHSVSEMLPANTADKIMTAIKQATENGTSQGQVIKLPIKNGERWFELSTSRKRHTDSSSHFLILSRDITEKRHIELEKKRMQRELQQSRKMESLGHLTGGIAHDFNNILQVISGFTDLALEVSNKNGDSQLVEYLTHLNSASARASNLVLQMQSFSRQNQVESLPMELATILKEEIKLFRATFPSTIEIETSIEDKLPVVLMNPTQLQQVIMNLCVNARDAMNGQGKLGIRLGWIRNLDTVSQVSHKPLKGDWVEIAISDTGSGINPDIIEDIFTPFYTTKAVGQGTGMGLSVVYGIMENHGSHIMLDTEVNKGTCVHLLFPPVTEITSVNSNSKPQPTKMSKGHGETILIVDDEQAITKLMAEILKNAGFQPITVTDSVEARILFTASPDKFDLLVTDQTMPKLTGIELIKELRYIRPKLQAILCTGFSDMIEEHEAKQKNIHFFKKPVNVQKLTQKIQSLFSKEHEKEAELSIN